MKSLSALAVALGTLAAPFAIGAEITEPVSESRQYSAYIGGLPLGVLDVDLEMRPDGYEGKAKFEMTALLRMILDTDANVSVKGSWQDGKAKPESFDYWLRDRKKRRTAEMQFNEAGDPVNMVANPPFRVKSYDMDIAQARGALDPASAAVMMLAPREEVCGLDLRVFDGRKLHGITLSPTSKKAKGDRVYCTGRYERLAGFKAKHMTEDERTYDFVAELRPDGPNRWVPLKIWAPTKFGVATAVLR